MKLPKVDNSGVAAANAAVAQAQAAANNLQKNFATDLNTENVASVVAGGSAESASAPTASSGQRRRPKGAGLSSQLGINV